MTIWGSTDLDKLISCIESGGRPKGGASEDSGDIPSLGGENIRQSGGLDLESVKKVPLAFFERMSKGILEPGDVLINKDGANTGKVGLYEGQFSRASINEHLFRLRGNPERLTQRFLYYLLLSPMGQENIRARISGSAQPGLKRDFIRDFPVHVPASTKEQSRIADVLATIDRTIEQTEALIAKYRRIKTGLMQDLLTRGIDENGNLRNPTTHRFRPSTLGLLPEDWGTHRLSDLTEPDAPICYGIVQAGAYVDYGIPTLTIRDLGGDYRTGIHRTSPAIDEQYSRSRVRPRDLLLSVKGSTGQADVVPAHFHGNISRDIARIRFSDGSDPDFYRFYFQSSLGQRALDLITVGTTRKEISIAPLKQILVPFPRQEEQAEIATVLKSQQLILTSLEGELAKQFRLKSGLMQDLLTGKVSVAPLLVAY